MVQKLNILKTVMKIEKNYIKIWNISHKPLVLLLSFHVLFSSLRKGKVPIV